MKISLEDFLKRVRPRMLRHLEEDILPYWLLSTMLGAPIGYFPTYANQSGIPDNSMPRYARMHGRQTYAYLAGYYMLGQNDLLNYGLAGLEVLKKYENPRGGYFAQVTSEYEIIETPISIQDQCYSVFPYIMAYRVTKNKEYLMQVWKFVEFIDHGPYLRTDGSYRDSLMPDLETEARFETPTLNLVSVIDFMNLILIPLLCITPYAEITNVRKDMLVKWMDLLVHDFWSKGIFWNDKHNRLDWQAKHVDLGHTSKAYGILLKANRLFSGWGLPERHCEIVDQYPKIVRAASAKTVGWLTDFDVSATTFRRLNLQWWRHIMVNQTVFHYASSFDDLIPLLENGIGTWFECEYVDRTRSCRGVREGLNCDGTMISNDESLACKANCWKNAYHEVEHILTFCEEE